MSVLRAKESPIKSCFEGDGLQCLRENWSFGLVVEYNGQETSAIGAKQSSPAAEGGVLGKWEIM